METWREQDERIRFQVAKGAAWLDNMDRISPLNPRQSAPWWEKIDLDILDLDYGRYCILGQLFATHAATYGYLDGYVYVAEWMGEDFVIEHGFLASDAHAGVPWRREIHKRVQAAKESVETPQPVTV